MKRTTLILLLVALGLGGFVYFYEIRGDNQKEEVKETQKQLFSFSADDVQSLSIKTKDITLRLERNSTEENPEWLINSPISEPANDAIVFYLMDLLVKGKSEQTISAKPQQISDFGLDNPQATIDIQLKNQQSHQVILGKPNFNNSFLYAQIDANKNNESNESNENEAVEVLLVSKDFANAVNRELSEWQTIDNQETENNESESLPGLPESIKNNNE